MIASDHDYIDRYNKVLIVRELADSTVKTYKRYLQRFLDWTDTVDDLKSQSLYTLTADHILSYIEYLQTVRNLSNRTINGHLAQIHGFWCYGMQKSWVEAQIPTLRFREALIPFPTHEEALMIINSTTNPKHRAQLAVLYSSGIRIGELVSLKCNDINVTRNVITISEMAKNGSAREALLSKKALEDLTAYIRSDYHGARKDMWLFPSKQSPSKHVCTETVRQVFRQACERCGLDDKGYTPHSFRHSFAVELLLAGNRVEDVQRALGHKSIKSTEKYLRMAFGDHNELRSPYDDDDTDDTRRPGRSGGRN